MKTKKSGNREKNEEQNPQLIRLLKNINKEILIEQKGKTQLIKMNWKENG